MEAFEARCETQTEIEGLLLDALLCHDGASRDVEQLVLVHRDLEHRRLEIFGELALGNILEQRLELLVVQSLQQVGQALGQDDDEAVRAMESFSYKCI